MIVEDGRARGLRLRRGGEVRARRGVISNATIWDTLRLVPEEAFPKEFRSRATAAPQTESIVHLRGMIAANTLVPVRKHMRLLQERS